MSSNRILIAEDDPAFRRVIEFTLQRSGWKTRAVCDGESAWQILQQEPWPFLITDHQMPRLSGIELIDRIRHQLPLGHDMELVLCTAKGLELDAARLTQEYRLLRVMHKPFSPRELASLLESSKPLSEGFVERGACT